MGYFLIISFPGHMFLYQQFNFVEKQFIMEVLGNTCMVEFIILGHIVVSRKQINYNYQQRCSKILFVKY